MMSARLTLALLLASAPALSGCIAAAVPLIAAGAMGREQLRGGGDARREERGIPTQAVPIPRQAAAQGAPAPTPAPAVASSNAPPGFELPVPGKPAPSGMQYLYGSGESAALSMQAYQFLWNFLLDRAEDRKAGRELQSVVLSQAATLAAPRYAPCGKKPLAAVFDVDETVLLNLGYEHDEASRGDSYDDARWKRWEVTGADKVAAVPGAIDAIEGARRAGVVIVFNSNRSEINAEGTAAAIRAAGLGEAKLGETLWLRGEGPGRSGKDERRWAIAEKYCVVALVGDQLGDFSDLFNPGGVPVAVRRTMASQTMVSPLWGLGWFILPNPVYGTGLHGSLDEVFPADKRWTDPGAAGMAPPETAPQPVAVEPAPATPQ